MFRTKTVFVLGAGASAEVGLPVGSQLLQQIIDLTHITYDFHRMKSGDYVISEALKLILDEGGEVQLYNEHLHAARQLGESAKQALSIDNVIEALEDEKTELIGKLGIVRAILQAESASEFFRHENNQYDRINLDQFNETWYSFFSKLLTENVKKSGIGEIFENLEIINFNYDRCLEKYLPFSIGNYYGIPPNEIWGLVKKLPIHRPYGIAGRLPWQDGEIPSVEFGTGNAEQLANVAKQIRTFTERIEEEKALESIKKCISDADRIVFLGFAFHRQNVELISSQVKQNVEILGTSHKISESDQNVIREELCKAFCYEDGANLANIHVELVDSTCRSLFENYWRTLTA